MDQIPIPDWVAQTLGDNYAAYQTYSPYLRQVLSFIYSARTYAFVLIDQVTRKPDLATIALLIVVVFVSLKILDLLWQTLMFWVRLVRRVLFWGILIFLGMWFYARGMEGVADDMRYWVAYWQEARVHWEERERIATLTRQKHAPGGAWAARRG